MNHRAFKKYNSTCIIVIILLLMIVMLTMISCDNSSYYVESSASIDKEVELTVNNYSEYFYSNALGYIEIKESAFGSTYFVNRVHISFDLKQSADIKNIVITGTIDLPLDSSHLLHKEGKLPQPFSVNMYINGHGETDVFFQHGIGAYGGYSAEDFIITVESITGTLTLK